MRSLTRIYRGVHQRIPEPVDITIKSAFAPILSFLDFVRSFVVVIVVYRDHVGSFPVLAVAERTSLSLRFPPLTPRDLPPEVFGFLNANARTATEFESRYSQSH